MDDMDQPKTVVLSMNFGGLIERENALSVLAL